MRVRAMSPEHQAWLESQKEKLKDTEKNPCVKLYGAGPEAETCKHCTYLTLQRYTAKNYYKCKLRTITRGPATDHRVNWKACAKFQEKLN